MNEYLVPHPVIILIIENTVSHQINIVLAPTEKIAKRAWVVPRPEE